jgi:hypothetical protein
VIGLEVFDNFFAIESNLNAVYNVEFITPVHGNISRPEPSITEGIYSCLFVPKVALKYNWAAKNELSRGTFWYILDLLAHALAASNSCSHFEIFVNNPKRNPIISPKVTANNESLP